MRRPLRHFAFVAITVALGLAAPLLMLEGIFHFLPVNEGLRARPVDDTDPVFRFTANRTATWSSGWNIERVNSVRVNNAGFVNDQNYETDDRRPLLAVVGDSYVEAVMVPYAQTMQGVLAGKAAPGGRVCSFAASGAPLSQYVVWAREARVPLLCTGRRQ